MGFGESCLFVKFTKLIEKKTPESFAADAVSGRRLKLSGLGKKQEENPVRVGLGFRTA